MTLGGVPDFSGWPQNLAPEPDAARIRFSAHFITASFMQILPRSHCERGWKAGEAVKETPAAVYPEVEGWHS
jgi:hypothetical protein